MSYLDFERLDAIDAEAFRRRKPYPWINPAALLTDSGFCELRGGLPPVSELEVRFGVARKHGQRPHDRWVLEYDESLPLSPPWQKFMEEIRGDRYAEFIERLFGEACDLSFHWHYTPNGAEVSPHCDAVHKLGSHIFYFNTADDWDPSWGGETLILEDGGRMNRRSAPEFADFDEIVAAEALGNRSLLFMRNGNSWHGVRTIRCPEDRMRKVFIVVINRRTGLAQLRRSFLRFRRGY